MLFRLLKRKSRRNSQVRVRRNMIGFERPVLSKEEIAALDAFFGNEDKGITVPHLALRLRAYLLWHLGHQLLNGASDQWRRGFQACLSAMDNLPEPNQTDESLPDEGMISMDGEGEDIVGTTQMQGL